MRKILSSICAMIFIFVYANTAMGDMDIYHVPTDQQISASEALSVMTTFWLELCSIDICKEMEEGKYTALFGPGYQWGVDTEDDCWVIEIPFGADIPIRPLLIVHGTTGDILYWEYRDKEEKIVYLNMIPESDMLSDSEATSIALDHFNSELGITDIRTVDFRINKSFGMGKYIVSSAHDEIETLPVWNILISFEENNTSFCGDYYLSAVDGSLISFFISDE